MRWIFFYNFGKIFFFSAKSDGQGAQVFPVRRLLRLFAGGGIL